MISNSTKQALAGKPRMAQSFGEREEAEEFCQRMKSEGKGNVRLSRFTSFVDRRGHRVWAYMVRWNAE